MRRLEGGDGYLAAWEVSSRRLVNVVCVRKAFQSKDPQNRLELFVPRFRDSMDNFVFF